MLRWLPGFLLLGLLAGSSFAQQGARLRVGLHDARPLAYLDEQGTPGGFAVLILEYIASQEDWEIEWVYDSWPELYDDLLDGELDLLFPMIRTAEREEHFDFSSEGLLLSWGRVFARPTEDITTILDLQGKKVAAIRGDGFHEILLELAENFEVEYEVRTYPSLEELVAAVQEGLVEVAVLEEIAGHWHVEGEGLRRTPVVFQPSTPHIVALRGTNASILEKLDEWLGRLKNDRGSIYYRFYAEHIRTEESGVPPWVQPTLLGGGVLLVLAFAFNTALRRQVRRRTRELRDRNDELEQQIARRRRVEDQLRESDKRWRTVIENMPVMLNAVDRSGLFVAWNKECERVTGYSAEEIIKNPKATELLYPDPEYREQILTETKVRRGRYKNWERNYVAKDGSTKTISRSSISHRFPIPGWASWGIGIDITERKAEEERRAKLEDQLRQSQKMEALGQIASGIAHDFKNLLTVITLHTDQIRNAQTPEEREESLAAAGNAIRQASTMTHSLLAFGRKLDSSKEPLSLPELVDEGMRMLASALPANVHFEFQRHTDSDLWVHADRNQLHQVLLNLVVNARDAMPDGGNLRVELASESNAPEETAVLSISDTGAGMPAERVARIFEPYFTTKARQQGTGLGLAIVHGIVQEHGGTIAVESEVGQGTTFRVRLPCVPAPAPSEVCAPAPDSPRGGDTILLGESSQQVRQIVAASLQGRGYEILQARDGGELLAHIDERSPQLRLLLVAEDLVDTQGRPVLEEVRRRGFKIPTVLMVNDDGEGAPPELGEDTALLSKPFRMSQLESAVHGMLLRPQDDDAG